jgi:acyl phosphate:glycerol-3-phosphate acyltransferase
MTLNILFIVLAYLVGAIPVGVILSKIKGIDPRKTGSGNIGATNVMRAAGKAFGLLTLIGDALKGLIPTLIAINSSLSYPVIAAIGLAAFLGHIFPVYLKFKGGKGVATALGVYIAISPYAILISFIAFILTFLKWRFVSLGSLIGTGIMPFALIVLKAPTEYIYLSLAVGILIFIKHKDNIKRLADGKESRFGRSG